jgi:peptidoglycan hydrolase CwlO-like protein
MFLTPGKLHEEEIAKMRSDFETKLKSCEDQINQLNEELIRKIKEVDSIKSREKELTSFQVNQKEIIGKYEDNLKKTKEENESLKKGSSQSNDNILRLNSYTEESSRETTRRAKNPDRRSEETA